MWDFIASRTAIDPAPARSDAVLTMCGSSKRIPDSRGDRAEIEAALPGLGLFEATVLPGISHGMCGGCHRARTRLEDEPAGGGPDMRSH